MSRSIALTVAGLVLWIGAAAHGQTPAPVQPSSTDTAGQPAAQPQTGDAATTVKPLAVTGKQPDYQRYVDRRSYSLTGDLRATNGSIGDALRNVPSVDVDPQGNVSLRGDSSVTIMVDGQPSVLFQGQGRAAALQQIPADQYERVEVITNPSAAFKPDGTGGVINLISKKSRHSKPTLTITIGGDTLGRYNGAVSGTYASNGVSLTGNGGYRWFNSQLVDQTAETVIDPASGETASVSQDSHARNRNYYVDGTGSIDADLDSNTRLSANLSYGWAGGDHAASATYRSSAPTGVLAQDYDNTDFDRETASEVTGAASYRRQLGGEDHEVDLNLQYSRTALNDDDRQTFDYQLPVQPDLFQDIASITTAAVTDLKAEYHQPLRGQAKLLVGYELEYDQNYLSHQGSLGTNADDAAAQPLLTDRFTAGQAAHDLYATYEHPFGRLDLMPGVRLEEVVLNTDQITSDLKDNSSYFEVYPTLHTAYRLNSTMQVTASYSRRVDRPDPSLLNPFRVYNNPLSFSQGNPRLRPAITDSYEAAFEYGEKSVYYLATLYFRDTHGLVSQLTENLGGGVLLGTYGNVGHSRNAGLELVANGRITKTLTYSLTGDAYWNQLTDPDVTGGPPRSGTVLTFKPKLKWDATSNDYVQINAYVSTKSPTAQGYASGYFYMDVGYRHRVGDRLSLVAQLRDPTNGLRFTTVTDTPTLKQTATDRYRARALSVGLTYDLGAPGKPAAKDIDFGGAAPAH